MIILILQMKKMRLNNLFAVKQLVSWRQNLILPNLILEPMLFTSKLKTGAIVINNLTVFENWKKIKQQNVVSFLVQLSSHLAYLSSVFQNKGNHVK